jgi:hypothetical protein
MASHRSWMTIGLAWLCAACGTEGDGDRPEPATTFTTAPPPSTTAVETTDTGDATQGASGQATTSDATTEALDGPEPGTGPIFDVGLPDVPPAEGCRNIDFLFVIDNSGSMSAQQQHLLDSFPGFIAAIQASLVDVDSYHVGVMTSDAYYANEAGCDVLGGLVTQTESGACGPFVAGQRFITEDDDLATAFQCRRWWPACSPRSPHPAAATRGSCVTTRSSWW